MLGSFLGLRRVARVWKACCAASQTVVARGPTWYLLTSECVTLSGFTLRHPLSYESGHEPACAFYVQPLSLVASDKFPQFCRKTKTLKLLLCSYTKQGALSSRLKLEQRQLQELSWTTASPRLPSRRPVSLNFAKILVSSPLYSGCLQLIGLTKIPAVYVLLRLSQQTRLVLLFTSIPSTCRLCVLVAGTVTRYSSWTWFQLMNAFWQIVG